MLHARGLAAALAAARRAEALQIHVALASSPCGPCIGAVPGGSGAAHAAPRSLSHASASSSGSGSRASASGPKAGASPSSSGGGGGGGSGSGQDGGGTLPQQPELVAQYLSPELMNRKQLLDRRKGDVIQRFQRFAGDTGSPEVQVALLTERIRDLMEHFNTHRKDHHSMRGLQALLNQRRALLSYLRRADFGSFAYVIHSLGLRDNAYAKQARYDKYRVGSRLGQPAEPIKRYGFR